MFNTSNIKKILFQKLYTSQLNKTLLSSSMAGPALLSFLLFFCLLSPPCRMPSALLESSQRSRGREQQHSTSPTLFMRLVLFQLVSIYFDLFPLTEYYSFYQLYTIHTVSRTGSFTTPSHGSHILTQPRLVCENVWVLTLQHFRCYLTNNIQLLTNQLKRFVSC